MVHRTSPDDTLHEELFEWFNMHVHLPNGDPIHDDYFSVHGSGKTESGDRLYMIRFNDMRIFAEPKTAIDLKLALGLYGRPVEMHVFTGEAGEYVDIVLV
jgi:hypothetical protein